MKNRYYNFAMEDYIHLTQCYDREFKPNHIMPEIHKHNGLEIMYVVNGNCQVEFFDVDESNQENLNQKPNEIYHLFPGDFIFLESYRKHRLLVSSTGARIINIECVPSADPSYPGQRTFGRMIDVMPKIKTFVAHNPSTFRLYDSSGIFNSLYLLIQKYTNEPTNKIVIDLMIQVVIFDIATLYMDNFKSFRGYSYVKQAVFIIENSLGNITPDELAYSVGISRNYVHKLFKTCFDTGISQYINIYKIKRACSRIKSFPHMKISDIALELGYNSLLQFERAFKKVMNMPPSAYKQKIKKSTNIWVQGSKINS